jgi:hypothetical protein
MSILQHLRRKPVQKGASKASITIEIAKAQRKSDGVCWRIWIRLSSIMQSSEEPNEKLRRRGEDRDRKAMNCVCGQSKPTSSKTRSRSAGKERWSKKVPMCPPPHTRNEVSRRKSKMKGRSVHIPISPTCRWMANFWRFYIYCSISRHSVTLPQLPASNSVS